MSGIRRESKAPRALDQLLAALTYGPLTAAQLRIRLRNEVTTSGVSSAIQQARKLGLIECRPHEGWALVRKAGKVAA